MGWIILILMWIAATMVVTIPYVNQIENLKDDRDKIFSYIVFAVGGPAILISGFIVDVLEKLGIVFEDDDDGDNDDVPWKRY